MSIWDDPELRVGGDFFKFNDVGDSIAGTISVIRAQRWDDGKVDPQVILTTDDGEEKTVTAGQIRLKTALAEQRPEAGDHITMTLTDIEKRAGGKTLKHFDVVVGRGGKPAASPAPAAAPAAAPTAQPAPVPAAAPAAPAGGLTPEQQAALSALTPEQKAALGMS